ncbi:MAG TPA: hypothetical protein VG455_16660, partial [Acidimicrobiales bacterium]|nr:hypothetical protein [Acidimicrobiales bacterium]
MQVAAFVLGLLVGSFLNATAWRLQSRRTTAVTTAPGRGGVAGERPDAGAGPSMWFGRSACPG